MHIKHWAHRYNRGKGREKRGRRGAVRQTKEVIKHVGEKQTKKDSRRGVRNTCKWLRPALNTTHWFTFGPVKLNLLIKKKKKNEQNKPYKNDSNMYEFGSCRRVLSLFEVQLWKVSREGSDQASIFISHLIVYRILLLLLIIDHVYLPMFRFFALLDLSPALPYSAREKRRGTDWFTSGQHIHMYAVSERTWHPTSA